MSTDTTHNTDLSAGGKPIAPEYYTGPERYLDWIWDYLAVRLSDAQREIIRTVTENRKTVVVGANGFGKSFAIACLALAFQYTDRPSTAIATSGTYGKLRRTLCKPIQKLHQTAVERGDIPGEYKHSPPRVEIDGHPEWYFEAARPRDAGELEGTHNDFLLSIIEEADKDAVNASVLDSMESLLTDDRDRIVVIANPPKTEANLVHDLMGDDSWATLQYSSFASHNVQVELGDAEGPYIDGMDTLQNIRESWVSYNDREWPGVDEARASASDTTLDERWFRRRLGRVPPNTATVHRPIETPTVERAHTTDANFAVDPTTATPRGLGFDVARMGGDSNAVVGLFGDELHVLDTWKGADHNENNARFRRLIGDGWDATLAIDAAAEGSGLGDRVATWYPDTHRFNAGRDAVESREYKNCWSEGLYHLGQTLQTGSFANRRLREELLAASRTIEYDEKYYASRDTSVLKATSKDALKDQLGRSPDVLDAALMAVWAAEKPTRQTADRGIRSF